MTSAEWKKITHKVKDLVESHESFAAAFQAAYERLRAAGEASKSRRSGAR